MPQHVDAAVIADIADWLMLGHGQRPFTRFISGRRQDYLAARARGYSGLVRRRG